jgi:uncharacterized protein (DUF1499 family)
LLVAAAAELGYGAAGKGARVTAIYIRRTVHEGIWARRIALFFLQLLILTVLLHRFGMLGSQAAINLFMVSLGGLVLAICVSAFALARIWFGGQLGARDALAGIAYALVGLAVPAWFLSHALILPRLTDVNTNPSNPVQFKQLAAQRPADANVPQPPDATEIALQRRAYPDLQPLELERSVTETFEIVHEAVKRVGWTVVAAEPPAGGAPGHIEATDYTLIMGLPIDIAVRVAGDEHTAEVDMRSASRYGPHDLGENAERVRAAFAEVHAALEKGEKTSLEQAEPKPKTGAVPQLKKPVKKRRVKRNRRPPAAPPPDPGGFPLLSPD